MLRASLYLRIREIRNALKLKSPAGDIRGDLCSFEVVWSADNDVGRCYPPPKRSDRDVRISDARHARAGKLAGFAAMIAIRRVNKQNCGDITM